LLKKYYVFTLFISLVSFILLPELAFASNLKDINDHWAKTEILNMEEKGNINGYPDGSFKPDNKITRAEFTKLVNKTLGLTTSDTSINYSDVSQTDWFYQDVLIGNTYSYIKGFPDNSFKPNEFITREQAAVVISRVLNMNTNESITENQFSDASQIGNWSISSINILIKEGIMKGYSDNTFKPSGEVTRAEAAVLLKRCSDRKIDTVPTTNPQENVPEVNTQSIARLFEINGGALVMSDATNESKEVTLVIYDLEAVAAKLNNVSQSDLRSGKVILYVTHNNVRTVFKWIDDTQDLQAVFKAPLTFTEENALQLEIKIDK
jgi:hypothetical protein